MSAPLSSLWRIVTSPVTPPPGTRENAVAAQTWRLTAWIAGGFTLLVGLGMITAQVRHKASDPWRSPVLLELRAQLRTEPKNEALKQEIRELDLGLRERYFHWLSFKATGVYLIFGGALVFLYAGNRVRLLHKRPPLPQPDPEATARLIRQTRLSRTAVAVCSGVALVAFSLLALNRPRSPLADPEALANVLAGEESPGQPAHAVTAEELRANWPRFRGHEGSGVAGAGPSLESAPLALWHVPAPAPGFNSPLVWKEQLFFTGGDAETREVFCLSATTGELVWRQSVTLPVPATTEDAPEISDMTGYAASTAATDGVRVYAIFTTGELAAFTLAGQPLWSKHLGPLDNLYGHAASLATWQNQVLVQLDQGYEDSRKSKLVCFDGPTGKITWQQARPVGASWATPIVIEAAGKTQVITLGLPWVMSYQPQDGTELWRAKLLEGEITPSPVFASGLLLLIDPGMYQLLALRPDGSGDVTKTHEAWRVDGEMPDISSPVSNGEHVFTFTTGGTLTCFDTKTGEEVWKESLDAHGEFQASPSLAGDTLLLLSAGGDVIGVEAGREFRELWRMQLEDQFYATPAFANGKGYLRGNKNVWCLGGEAAMTKNE